MGTPFIVTLVILIAVVLLAATIYNKLVRLRSAIGNAFAAGWHQQDSVVAVKRGALERLTRDELQGVVAHELSHNLHGNTRLNMRLIGYVYGLQMLFNYGRAQFGATDGHNRGNLGVVPGLALMRPAAPAGWPGGRLLKAVVARDTPVPPRSGRLPGVRSRPTWGRIPIGAHHQS